MAKRKLRIFTSTDSMAIAKQKAKSAGYSVKASREVPFGNTSGFVVYAKPRTKR